MTKPHRNAILYSNPRRRSPRSFGWSCSLLIVTTESSSNYFRIDRDYGSPRLSSGLGRATASLGLLPPSSFACLRRTFLRFWRGTAAPTDALDTRPRGYAVPNLREQQIVIFMAIFFVVRFLRSTRRIANANLLGCAVEPVWANQYSERRSPRTIIGRQNCKAGRALSCRSRNYFRQFPCTRL